MRGECLLACSPGFSAVFWSTGPSLGPVIFSSAGSSALRLTRITVPFRGAVSFPLSEKWGHYVDVIECPSLTHCDIGWALNLPAVVC